MSQTLNLKNAGLYTAPNPFSGAPDGAWLVGDDVVVDQTNLAGPRRGFDLLTGSLPLNSDRINRFDYYQGLQDASAYILAHWGTTKFGYYSAGVWTAYSGSFSAPDVVLARVRFLQQNKNFYFTTSAGIYKLDSVEHDTPRAAGVPQGLDIELALTGSSGFFSQNSVGTFVGTVTSGSPIVTGLTSLPGNIAVGNYVSDTNTYFAAGTTVLSLQASAQVLIATGNITAGSTSMTSVSPTTGIVVGQIVTGTGIPSGTTVTVFSGTTATLSASATATTTGVAVTFSSAPTVTMSANASGGAPTSETITYSTGGQVAYRLIWGYKDANNNLVLGAPTQWVSVANTTGASANVQVTSSIPSGITTAYFYQIYRTFQTPTSLVTPSDEMQLCYAGNPDGTDISNGYIQITDSLIDALLGTTLYTSPSQGGIGQAYLPPPMSKDFCSFRNYTFYANTQSQQTLNLTMIGVGAPNGVQVNDTIVIDGITFTAKASQTIASNEFKVFSTGTLAQNITNTVNSLVQVINRSSTSTVYAYNISGPTELPGKMVISTRTFTASAFVVTVSGHGSAYNPTLPTSGSTVSSAQVIYKNGVYVSVQGQPEAVPGANLLPLIGSASSDILRIIALRDYVVVLKSDGVFRIVGTSLSNFDVLPFDYTTHLIAPDSAVSLNNQVWCLANQGVVSISDTGVQQQSWTNINDIIQGLFGTSFSAVQQYASAVSYETEHKYILGLPSSSGDTGNTQTYTYNIFTAAWTRWTRQFTSGFIHPATNNLYLGNFQNNLIVTERKTGTYQDFIDEPTIFPTIVSSTNYVVTLNSIIGISVGSLLYVDSTHASVIASIDVPNSTVTVQDLVTWVNGAATIYPPINSIIQWKPAVAGNPGYLRQYTEGDFLFNTTRFNTATVSFFTELNQALTSVPLTGFALGNWGLFPWGTVPWGGLNQPTPIRFLIPVDSQLGSQLNVRFSISQAWSNWALSGVNVVYNDVGQEMDG